MAGLSFDDLIPAGGDKKSSLTFEDLIAGNAPKDVGNQPIDASTVYVDEMMFGLPGKASAGLNALVRAPFTDKTVGEEYDTLRNQYKNAREQYATEHPVANAAASIGGAIQGGATGGGYTGQILSRVAPAVSNAMRGSYIGSMAGDAAAGASQGALSAYGHDENIGLGAGIGGAVGGLARPVISLGGQALSTIGGLVGLGNTSRANSAIAEALTRAGATPDDIANQLTDAVAAGQPQYTVADALGNSGQRMLTGIVRAPGDARQGIVEALQARQAGQGRRLQGALEDAFGAPQTLQQTVAAQEAARAAEATQNYGAARAAAGAVDPTAAISQADNFLGEAVIPNTTAIRDDTIEGAVRRARSYLTDGTSQVSDFSTALRAKQEIDNLIENGSRSQQAQLIPIRNQLDDALAQASGPYANARDTFRRQSQDIEAANTGRTAAMRGRVEDTVPQFQALSPEGQQSFRAGYVDPYIETLQGTAGAGTNRARPLLTDATAVEFPAFAIPGQADQLMARIGREQTMSETMGQALGGSRTADNLNDVADVGNFDPSIIAALGRGDFGGAALQGLSRAVNTASGRNSQTRDLIGAILMQGDPTQARLSLARAVQSGQRLTDAQQSLVRALIGGTATAEPKLIAD